LSRPTERAKRGRKKGGTKRGKIAIEVPRRRKQNEGFLKRFLAVGK